LHLGIRDLQHIIKILHKIRGDTFFQVIGQFLGILSVIGSENEKRPDSCEPASPKVLPELIDLFLGNR
jgi:hypothetical protein